jgi:AraC family transcriptional regulator
MSLTFGRYPTRSDGGAPAGERGSRALDAAGTPRRSAKAASDAMQQQVERFARDRDIEFTVRHSSRDRCWTGLVATIYEATPGFDETLFSNHSVSMHVGTPVGITTRCDGAVSRRFQVPGDIKIVPAGFSRIWEVEGLTTKITIGVNPSLVRTAADEMGVNADRVAIVPQLHVRDSQIEHIAWAIKAELESDAPFGRLYADSLGLALAAHLLRRYGRVPQPAHLSGISQHRLRRVVAHIRDHLADDLTLAELAGIANVSQSHFKVLFKRSTGVPVHEYVIRARVDYAVDLLLNDDAPLSEIALQAGFANQSHMALCMRRLTGKTPAALRRT